MTQFAIATDLNRCVGCLACSVSCKAIHDVNIGNYWCKNVRIGPNPTEGGSGQFPDVEMYYITLQCQHCNVM
jgi:Fe-S-cluster-containing dehydrogenase component